MNQQEIVSRKIVISSEINNEVAERVISQILDINDFDSHMSVVNTYQPEPIEIFINSNGGSVSDGFAIIGAMEMSQTPIITYGLGLVASMALGIFVKGDFRVSSRHTRFMYHSISYGAMGYIKEHEDAQKECNLLQQMYNSLFKNTNLTKDMMESIRESKANFFFSAKEGRELGIVDEIIKEPEKRIIIEQK